MYTIPLYEADTKEEKPSVDTQENQNNTKNQSKLDNQVQDSGNASKEQNPENNVPEEPHSGQIRTQDEAQKRELSNTNKESKNTIKRVVKANRPPTDSEEKVFKDREDAVEKAINKQKDKSLKEYAGIFETAELL